MRRRRQILAAAVGVAALLLAACSGGSSSNSSSGGKAQSGGTITFAEQPGSPPTYIFPLYDGANSGNNNITYLQPLMWLPLYWFGHSNNAQATINYGQSMAYPPVFFVTATSDDRVTPVHARKMAAKLQAMGYEAYFYEPAAGGHGVDVEYDYVLDPA